MQHMKINTWIAAKDRATTAKGLSHLLAETYTRYIKTTSFHGNATGQMFQTLHTMFEQQYTELWTALDEVAGRIRSLGELAPGSYKTFAKLTSIKEEIGRASCRERVCPYV